MPSASMTWPKPPMKPLLYTSGCSWILVLTTSTGTKPPCVIEQQMPPASAPDKKYFMSKGPWPMTWSDAMVVPTRLCGALFIDGGVVLALVSRRRVASRVRLC